MCRKLKFAVRLAAAILIAFASGPSFGALTYSVDAGSPWPSGWYNAAVANMQTVVNMLNAYGDFGNGNINVYYNAGIPTAQSGYGGYGSSIGVGGTYPNARVLLHESSHWLGTGTYSANWGGPNAAAIIQQFEGVGAVLNGDGVHYWPYGQNYDSESSPINDARTVALIYALRKDFGIGSTARPSPATNVVLTASDAAGTSGFNYPWGWSDSHFAQPGTNYSTGNFALRTPQGTSSWTFAGESLRVNNQGNPNGGLLFNGWGTTGVVTIKNLVLDGGTIKHDQFSQDLFQLNGNIALVANTTSTINAAQGNIQILAPIASGGSLQKTGANTLTLTNINTYTGDTTISAGTLKLASVVPVANYTFDLVSGSTVVNRGSGGTAMNGALAGGAAIVAGGVTGNAVSLAGGASVNINNPITDLGATGNWTVSAWVKTSTPGSTILTKGDGSGWTTGNSIFYLGDGAAGGSGGIPSAVRYAGGFFQGSTAATPVTNNAWHQVTYTNSAGSYALYVDGVAQPLSAGNASFSNADVGAIVRLGVTTNTVPADGTVNFNGLMDNVQFYSQALSAQQVGALYQGSSVFGSLPTTTNVTIASGAKLDINGAVQQIGSLTGVAGSSVLLGSGKLTVDSPASTQFAGGISGTGSFAKQGAGTLTLSGANTFSGQTFVNAGALRVNGLLSGNATVATGATLAGNGSIGGLVAVANGGVLAPGTTTGLMGAGALSLDSGATLQIDLAGTTRGSLYDAVLVSGNASLNGTLQVSLTAGFMPAAGDVFDVLDWSTLSGNFAAVNLPALSAGLAWDATRLASTGELLVASQLTADFDANGVVDGADLTAWQLNFGTTGSASHSQGDANADLAVDGADFLQWQRQAATANGGATTAAVPEPPGGLLAVLASLAANFGERRRRLGSPAAFRVFARTF